MGRCAFHNILEDKEVVISDSQPELVRGISHSANGESIFISIGDITCQRLDSEGLNSCDFWQIIDDPETDSAHRTYCERSYTMNYQHWNCVTYLTKPNPEAGPVAPINMSDLDNNVLQPYGEGEFVFDHNTVPYDFDGKRLLYMIYDENQKNVRDLFYYDFDEAQRISINRFLKNEGMITHVKFLKTSDPESQRGKYIFWVSANQNICRFNIETKDCELIKRIPVDIISMQVTFNTIKEKEILYLDSHNMPYVKNKVDPENEYHENQEECHVICIDESENIHIISLSANGGT